MNEYENRKMKRGKSNKVSLQQNIQIIFQTSFKFNQFKCKKNPYAKVNLLFGTNFYFENFSSHFFLYKTNYKLTN